jgi:Na+/melibiose symporter-like transporter
MALTAMFSAVPMLINFGTALSLRNYPLDAARQKELRAAIEARNAATAKKDAQAAS